LSVDAIVKLIIEAYAVAFSISFSAELDTIHAVKDAWVVALGSIIYIIAARQRSTINSRAALGNGGDLSVDARVELIIEANAVAFSISFTTELDVIHAVEDAWVVALGANILVIAAR